MSKHELPSEVREFALKLQNQINDLLSESGKKSTEDIIHLNNILELFGRPLIAEISELDDNNSYIIELALPIEIQDKNLKRRETRRLSQVVHTTAAALDLTVPIPGLAEEDDIDDEPIHKILAQMAPLFSKIVEKVTVTVKKAE
jgi:predicted mannosyl-3-phosphoglycerate phosphatase (HAD superfamily)